MQQGEQKEKIAGRMPSTYGRPQHIEGKNNY
jgi:hypothetical protein